MKKVFILLLFSIAVFTGNKATAQAKTKDGTVTGSSNFPDANAVLELESANKGLLLPRVALTALDAAAPLGAHTAGMTVYNTATAGAGALAVSPGYYYNDGTKWVRINIEPWYNKATLAQATGNTDTIYTMGQVGIGTSSPQQGLHVASSNASSSTAIGSSGYTLVSPTIRVEGLNAANNMAHPAADGANSVKPVFVSSNGDLVTGKLSQLLAGNPNLSDDVGTTVTVTSSSGAWTIDTILKQTFTLQQTSLVSMSYDISINGIQSSSGSAITDGKARVISNHLIYVTVPAGSPVPAGKVCAHSAFCYTNASSTGTIPTGTFYNNGASSVVLTPGTYTIALMGDVYGGSASVKANFGDGATDYLHIVTLPL